MLNPGVTEVAYLCLRENEAPWSVVADHSGVTIRGDSPRITEHQQLEGFAWVIADALREMRNLRKARIQIVGDNEIQRLN